MLEKSKGDGTNYDRGSSSVLQMSRSAVTSSATPEVSSISSGLSIVGKIVGHGALTIYGHVEGELHASTVDRRRRTDGGRRRRRGIDGRRPR